MVSFRSYETVTGTYVQLYRVKLCCGAAGWRSTQRLIQEQPALPGTSQRPRPSGTDTPQTPTTATGSSSATGQRRAGPPSSQQVLEQSFWRQSALKGYFTHKLIIHRFSTHCHANMGLGKLLESSQRFLSSGGYRQLWIGHIMAADGAHFWDLLWDVLLCSHPWLTRQIKASVFLKRISYQRATQCPLHKDGWFHRKSWKSIQRRTA